MREIKKILSLLLAAALLVGVLSGCGGDTVDPAQETPDFVYTAAYSKLAMDGINDISYACWMNGRIYFVANIEEGTQSYTYPSGEVDENGDPIMISEEYPAYVSKLFSMAEDGSDVKKLDGFVPTTAPAAEGEGSYSNSYISAMAADGQNRLWIVECVSSQNYTGGDDVELYSEEYYRNLVYTQTYTARIFDAEGVEIGAVDLSAIEGDPDYGPSVNGVAVDAAGNLYVMEGNSGGLYVLDSEGRVLFSLAETNGWINTVTTTVDGSVCAMVYGGEKAEIRLVDVAAKGWGKASPAPVNSYGNFLPGSGDYDLYYNTDVSLMGYKLSTGESEKLFTWINIDVDSNSISRIMPLADGRILCISNNYDSDTPVTELVTLTKSAASEVSEKTVLTYACMYIDYNVRRIIISFNKTNPTYRIEVKDYSEYNTQDDYSAGLTKLTTEIIGGTIPDIIATDSLPFDQFASKGLFEDLWPLIEADTELGGRDALVEPLFKALSTGDKLYRITPGFSVSTTFALADVVGERSGWTLDEMMEAFGTLADGATLLGQYYAKRDILYNICSIYIDSLVDWETGKCSFDSDLFKQLLSLTEYFPAEYDDSAYDPNEPYVSPIQKMRMGEQLMGDFYLYGFSDYYWSTEGPDLSGISFVGYPTADGSAGSAFETYGGLAMSSACANKDGAWAFMRQFLTEDYNNNYYGQFSANANVLNKALKDLMTPTYTTDENGEKVEEPKNYYYGNDGTETPIYAMDQATADKLMGVINNTTRLRGYDEKISTIITDECAAYFAGQKSLDDTAKMIQSKVSLYVNEQK